MLSDVEKGNNLMLTWLTPVATLLQTAQEVTESLILNLNHSRTTSFAALSTQMVSFSRHLCSRRDTRVDKPIPKERLLEKAASKIQIYMHWTKPKIFIFSSDY